MATEQEILAEVEELGRMTPEQEDILYAISLRQDELGRQQTNKFYKDVVGSPIYQPLIDRELLTFETYNHGANNDHAVVNLIVTLKGTRYCIMFSDEIFAEAKAAGVITVPSAFSPSEIQLMMDKGADIVKVFPAGQLGPDYIKAVQAPLGKLPLMVVGGVNADNVQSYFDKGATYAGIGSGIFDPKDIQECNSANLAASIKNLEAKVNW